MKNNSIDAQEIKSISFVANRGNSVAHVQLADHDKTFPAFHVMSCQAVLAGMYRAGTMDGAHMTLDLQAFSGRAAPGEAAPGFTPEITAHYLAAVALVGAAPDLLAACKKTVGAWPHGTRGREILEAAIAKAEGGAP